MQKNTILFIVLSLIVGFTAGFLIANKLNRSELDALRGQSAQNAKAASNSAEASDDQLSNDEIKAKVAQADANPTNLSFQKNLGISLYRYGAMKQDAAILEDSKRLLERAANIDPKDFEVLVALGNAWFDTAFFKKDAASFEKAREIYGRALAVKPGDPDVKTDLGISYFVQEPADYEKAATELRSVLAGEPKHDRAMQFLAQTYVKQGKVAEAEKLVAKIAEINPGNTALADLRKQIAEAKARS